MPLKPHIKADFALLFLTILWGLSFPLVKTALAECGTFTFLTVRFFIGTILLLPFMKKKDYSVLKQTAGAGLLLGAFIFVGFFTQTWGLALTTSSRSGFLTGTLVIMVPFLAVPILKQKLTRRHLIAAFSAMLGIFFLTRPDASEINPGDILTLICAAAFAFQTVVIQKVGRDDYSLALTLYQVAFVMIASAPVGLVSEGFRGITSPNVWMLAGIVGVTSTGLGFWLQTHFQPRTSAQSAAVIFTMEPVFASMFAAIILSEGLPNPIGAAFILAGMVVAEWRR